jgi:hypothetical protein
MKALYKTFRFIGKFFAFVFLVSYVYIGGDSTFRLYKISGIRKQDIGAIHDVIRTSVAENHAGDVSEWLRARPQAETDALIDIVTPESGGLGSGVFFEFTRRRLQQGKVEEALFWTQLARYRLRFDTLRCGPYSSGKKLEDILSLFEAPDIRTLLEAHPALVKKSVQRVMDFDAKYPARNDPKFICEFVNRLNNTVMPPLPKDKWEDTRRTLRHTTEAALKEMK